MFRYIICICVLFYADYFSTCEGCAANCFTGYYVFDKDSTDLFHGTWSSLASPGADPLQNTGVEIGSWGRYEMLIHDPLTVTLEDVCFSSKCFSYFRVYGYTKNGRLVYSHTQHINDNWWYSTKCLSTFLNPDPCIRSIRRIRIYFHKLNGDKNCSARVRSISAEGCREFSLAPGK